MAAETNPSYKWVGRFYYIHSLKPTANAPWKSIQLEYDSFPFGNSALFSGGKLAVSFVEGNRGEFVLPTQTRYKY